MEVCIVRCQWLCQSRSRRLISVIILMVAAVLIFQNFSLSSKTVFSTQIPPDLQIKHDASSLNKDLSSTKDQNISLLSHSQASTDTLNLSETRNHQVTVGRMDREPQKVEKFDGKTELDGELDGSENRGTKFSILRKDSEDYNGEENPQLVADKVGIVGNASENMQEELSVNKVEMHPMSMSEMNSLLRKIRASYPSMATFLFNCRGIDLYQHLTSRLLLQGRKLRMLQSLKLIENSICRCTEIFQSLKGVMN